MMIELSSITKWYNLHNAKVGEIILLEGDRGPYIVTDIPLESDNRRKVLINLRTGEALYQPFGYYKRLNTNKELYEWAKENNLEDYEIRVRDYDGRQTFIGSSDDTEKDENTKEVLI